MVISQYTLEREEKSYRGSSSEAEQCQSQGLSQEIQTMISS